MVHEGLVVEKSPNAVPHDVSSQVGLQQSGRENLALTLSIVCVTDCLGGCLVGQGLMAR